MRIQSRSVKPKTLLLIAVSLITYQLDFARPVKFYSINEVEKSYEMMFPNKTNGLENWIRLLNKHRAYLIANFKKRSNLTEGQLEIFQIIKRHDNENLSVTIRNRLLNNLVELSLYNNELKYTGFIQDTVIFQIIIEAMNDENEEVRKNVFYYLSNYGKIDLLQKNSTLIKKNLDSLDYVENPLLIALLDLSIKEKEILLKQQVVSDLVRARLGDLGLEMNIISDFKNAKSYKEKYEITKKLGYIGTEKCTKALIEELGSPLILEAAYEHISIRYIILKTLGRIYPENFLFTIEINKIAQLGDDGYGGSVSIRKYLAKVADWCMKNHQVKPNIDISNTIIYKKILVKHFYN